MLPYISIKDFFRNRAILLALLASLGACSGSDDDKFLPETPVEQLYNAGMDAIEQKEWKKAASSFEEVERQHPYSSWAVRAQLMTAWSYWKALDYDAAIAALDQFIQVHPGSPQAAWAYYMRAMCFYEQIADVRRDQSYANNALKALQDVVARWPDSVYARDAALKISLVQDHLAGAEMEVGRNYLNGKIYTAALGRFRTVVEKYQTTSHTPEALYRLIECYLALGIRGEAQTAAAVLGHNFPGSKWYEDGWQLLQKKGLNPDQDKSSWLTRLWK